MRGVLSMTRNEIFKTRKQKGVFIILIILMVSFIVTPAITAAINSMIYSGSIDIEDQMLRWKSYMEESPKNFFYRANYEAYKFYYDNGIDGSDWRYQWMFSLYSDQLETRALLEHFRDDPTYPVFITDKNGYEVYLSVDDHLLLSYADPDVVSEYFVKEDYGDSYYSGGSYYYTKPGVNQEEAMQAAIASIDFDRAFAELAGEIADREAMMQANDTRPIHETNLKNLREQLKEAEDSVKAYRELLEKNPNDADARELLETSEREIKAIKETIPFYEYACEHNILLSTTDWRYNAIENVRGLIRQKRDHEIVSKEIYETTSFPRRQNMSYDAYVKNQNKTLSLLNEGIELIRYGLENDVPPPGTVLISTKSVWQSSLSSSMFMLTVFGVLLGGIILSNEFSSGTIRLLLIRPRRRYKHLLSKVLCLLTYLFGLLLVAYVLQFIVSAICTLGRDAFTPELWVIGGTIVKIPAALTVLLKALADLLPVLFYASLALMCSAIVTKAVFAIAIPILLYITSAFSSMIMASEFQTTAYNYTILAQNSLSDHLGNPFFSRGLFDIYANTPVPQLSLLTAIIIVGAHIAAVLIVSLVAFCKKQIKD